MMDPPYPKGPKGGVEKEKKPRCVSAKIYPTKKNKKKGTYVIFIG